MLKLSLRYWRVHWKKLVKVLFAMILSSAALMIAFLLARSSTEKSVQDVLNVNGNYDIVVQDLTKSQLDIFASDDQIAEYGIVQNGGVCCTKNETMIPYGAFLSKKAVDMFHYPVEKEVIIRKNQAKLQDMRVLFMQWVLQRLLEIKFTCNSMMPRVEKSRKETIPSVG